MNIGPSSILVQASRTASRVLDGKAVIIVIDRQTLHTLDEVGTLVWTQAERGVRVSELAGRIADEYEVSTARALEDVCAFASQLVSIGALVLENET